MKMINFLEELNSISYKTNSGVRLLRILLKSKPQTIGQLEKRLRRSHTLINKDLDFLMDYGLISTSKYNWSSGLTKITPNAKRVGMKYGINAKSKIVKLLNSKIDEFLFIDFLVDLKTLKSIEVIKYLKFKNSSIQNEMLSVLSIQHSRLDKILNVLNRYGVVDIITHTWKSSRHGSQTRIGKKYVFNKNSKISKIMEEKI